MASSDALFKALLCASLAAYGCTEWQAGEEDGPSSEDVAPLNAGEELRFSAADLIKPRHREPGKIDIYQAPLIVREVMDDPPSAPYDDTTATGESVFDPGLVVYYTETSSPVDRHEHRQLSYVWLYSSARRNGSPQKPEVQGLRLTQDRNGHPAVIEVLWSPRDLRVIYISRSLEVAASRQFGGPLPGRRYAVEQSIENQPRLVVAGVIEDGPEPMGPMVYLRAGGREVGTLTCRCMPSQVEEIRETREYELEPLDALGDVGAAAVSAVLSGETELGEALRLPEDF